ncbi:MAG: ArsR/SmtB family transcription factor [Caulobacteraceae bacterium]
MSMSQSPSKPLESEAAKALQTNAPAAARLMKMLANEQRLKLLCRLGKGETSAGELADYAGLSQSTASQHLARLRDGGIVATRRDAQTIYYRLADDRVFRVIGLLCELYR